MSLKVKLGGSIIDVKYDGKYHISEIDNGGFERNLEYDNLELVKKLQD